jgi:PTS system mannitol-specific IIC component
MKPILIIAAIVGGASGVLTFVLLNGGLIAPASPGSIIAYLLVSPPQKILVNLLGIIISAAVSFAVGSVLLGFGRNEQSEMSLEAAQESSDKNKGRKTARVGTARA